MATTQPGRNNPCSCGSGKKYKKCCMRLKMMDTQKMINIQSSARRILQEQELAMKQRREEFGEVRPVIHCDFKDHKFVAVGGKLLYSKKWKTFPDFLQDYIKHVLSADWGQAELSKPLKDRHVIMKWYDAMCQYQRTSSRDSDGLFSYNPNGSMRAYMLLSHDLYTLEHHAAFQSAVIKRLKHKEQFQGARHELFAAATCIRAGYDIEYEDETDNTSKHPEFTAIHRATGQKISVEAKSRHRPGILGRPGEVEPKEEIRVGIKRLLKDAINKPVQNPYVIFLDLNLPYTKKRFLDTHWFKEVGNTVVEVAEAKSDRDPFCLIVFSNQPDHYLDQDTPSPGGEITSTFGRNPLLSPSHPEAIKAIHDAANKFGNIPNKFDEAS